MDVLTGVFWLACAVGFAWVVYACVDWFLNDNE